MPYSISNPPAAIKDLPQHAQEIFIAAFNSAFKEYDGDEAKSFATAWAAVKSKYEQDAEGKWHAKARALTTRQQHSGAMVALFLPEEAARSLALADGEAPEDLHITLVYLGEADSLDREAVEAVVSGWAAQRSAISGKIGGVARFFTSEGDGTNALVALFDSPELPEFRQSLMNELGNLPAEQNHGFTPHITLRYIGEDEAMPDMALEPMEIEFNSLVLAWGGEYKRFNLGGEMDEETQARSLLREFFEKLRSLFQSTERRIKDVSSWDGAASGYASTDAYCSACLIDVNAAAGRSTKAQSHCMLPVRGPGDGADTYVRQAVHAAAGGHGISQVKKPSDVSQSDWDKALAAAARKLKAAYGEMEEEAPQSVTDMARAIPMQQIYMQVFSALEEMSAAQAMNGGYGMDEGAYPIDIYADGGDLYALVTKAGKLYRVALDISDQGAALGEWQQVVEEHRPAEGVATRTTIIRQADGRVRWLSVSATCVLNRVGEIDSAELFDSFVEHAKQSGQFPIRQFFHLGETFRTGQADFLARDGNCYITSGLWDDSELARAEQGALAENPDFWGESIGYLPLGAPEIANIGGFSIPVYRDGIHNDISVLPEKMAANLFTAPRIVAREGKHMENKGPVWEAFLALFGGDETRARDWLAANTDATNRTIEQAGMVTRQAEPAATDPQAATTAPVATDPPASAAPEAQAPAPCACQQQRGTAAPDFVLDDSAIGAIVERVGQLPAIMEMHASVGEASSEIKALRARLDALEAGVNGRLAELERSEEEKRRAFLADAPRARQVAVRYEPGQRPSAPDAQPASPASMAERARKNNPLDY